MVKKYIRKLAFHKKKGAKTKHVSTGGFRVRLLRCRGKIEAQYERAVPPPDEHHRGTVQALRNGRAGLGFV